MTPQEKAKINELWDCLSSREQVLAYQYLLGVMGTPGNTQQNFAALRHLHQVSRNMIIEEIYKLDTAMDSEEFKEEASLFLVTNPYWLAIQHIINGSTL